MSDPESYRRLSYKTLSGLLWTSLNCNHVKFVGKTDDDVLLDLQTLLQQLQDKFGRETNFLSCPSPSRNYKPIRYNQFIRINLSSWKRVSQDDKGGKHWSEVESNLGGFAT